MTTHISYSTAKKLKAFLGESAPEPMEDNKRGYYGKDLMCYVPEESATERHKYTFDGYAYRLEDLLSKPFCEAFLDTMENKKHWCPVDSNADLSHELAYKYFFGGLPAVEKALCEMMEGK